MPVCKSLVCAATYSGAVATRWSMGNALECSAALTQDNSDTTFTVHGAENSLSLLTVKATIPVMYHMDHISAHKPIVIQEPRLLSAQYIVSNIKGYPLTNAVQAELCAGEIRVTAHNISGKTIPETVVDIVLARISTLPIQQASSS